MKNIWTEDKFLENFELTDLKKIKEKVKSSLSDPDEALELNHQYPIYKGIAGVEIEEGYIKLLPADIQFFVDIFNQLSTEKQGSFFLVEQNYQTLLEIINKFSLEIADYSCCEGYILNYELINIVEIDGATELILKYKDLPHSTYILYKFGLARNTNGYLFVLHRFF
ncbi:MAG: hypothetical protein ACRCS8_01790 [Brevinema sp.]